MDYVTNIPQNSLKQVFLVHGELESMQALKADLNSKNIEVAIPKKGLTFEM
jgi:metallo-beta-lactamase family protein